MGGGLHFQEPVCQGSGLPWREGAKPAGSQRIGSSIPATLTPGAHAGRAGAEAWMLLRPVVSLNKNGMIGERDQHPGW